MVALHAVPGDGVTAESTAIDADARDPAAGVFNLRGETDEEDRRRPAYNFWDELADGAGDEDVAAWSPGMNVARPNGRDAQRPAAGAGGSNDPLPVQVQPYVSTRDQVYFVPREPPASKQARGSMFRWTLAFWVPFSPALRPLFPNRLVTGVLSHACLGTCVF